MKHDTPDPEFVDRLEWQIQSTLRRRALRNARARGDRKMTLLSSIGLIVASMCLGGAGTYAMTHERDDGLRALRVQRHTLMAEIAERTLVVHAQALEEAEAQRARGVVDDTHVGHMRLQLQQAESDLETMQLNLAEVRATGLEPNDSLAAPLVDGTDYVSARLEVHVSRLTHLLAAHVEEARTYRQQVEAGLIADAEGAAVTADVHIAEAEIEAVARRLELRQAFLRGEQSGEAVELQSMIDHARAARIAAEQHVHQISRHVEHMQRLSDDGAVSTTELRYLKIELHRAHAELELADIELKILETRFEGLVE